MAEKVMESKKTCIWVDAGVIQFKLCDSDYDCQSCEFDRAMTESAAKQLARRQLAGKPPAQKAKTVPWENKMRQRFGESRQCQFIQSDLCHQCSFDELLEEQFDFFLAPEKPQVHEVFGIQVPTPISCIAAIPGWLWKTPAGSVSAWTTSPRKCLVRPPSSPCRKSASTSRPMNPS